MNNTEKSSIEDLLRAQANAEANPGKLRELLSDYDKHVSELDEQDGSPELPEDDNE
ncbi:hypothetical protein [Pseudomonas sp. B26(2017)]|uniref:hypothetical protein n=1 Tax=Pseudomonas sp. B26(2017) TaxID=1981732 RepID=UPI0014834209|nr:hypothetical protein [Pseudomonas sp. B26(2017)]